ARRRIFGWRCLGNHGEGTVRLDGDFSFHNAIALRQDELWSVVTYHKPQETARPAKPRNSNSLTHGVADNAFAQSVDVGDDLESKNQRQFGAREIAIDDVKVSQSACLDFYPQLS